VHLDVLRYERPALVARGGDMAVWVITNVNGIVKLSYQRDSRSQECGSGDAVLLDSLVEWVVSCAQPGDIISVQGHGTFVRVAGPSAATRS
jgi:hypothetical protein